ncbi:MAG: heavy metal translocating P-type ATPase [Myxococcota bacterium]
MKRELNSLTLRIGGMGCASCVPRVEKALEKVSGVERAHVNLATKQASVRLSPETAPSILTEAVRAAGFDASIESRDTAPPDVSAPDRELRRDLLVAAGLTVPLFVVEMGSHLVPGLHAMIDGMVDRSALWAVQLMVTTLVLAGPGRRFFIKGYAALRRGAPDMNTLVALGTLAAYGYSVIATLLPTLLPADAVHVYYEAAAVVVTLVLLGRLLEERAKGRTSLAIQSLLELAPRTARVLRDTEFSDVPVDAVLVGDRVRLLPGERVPVDGDVVEGETYVDESMLTGEAQPVAKSVGDTVIGGTTNQAGSITFVATSVGSDTTLAQIVRAVEDAQGSKLPIQAQVDRVVRWFVPAVLVIAVTTFVAWLVAGAGLTLALVCAVAVLVVACPCAMGLATPTSIVVGTGRAAELGVFFRDGKAIELLGNVRVVAFDKTGTLTEGRPVVTDIETLPGFDRSRVLRAAGSAEARSEHPLARALVEAADGDITEADAFESHTGFGLSASVDGQRVAVGSTAWMSKLGVAVSSQTARIARWREQAKTVVCIAIDERLAAVVAIRDPIKSSSGALVDALRTRGLRVAMITGDGTETARAIATELGIDEVIAEVMPSEKADAVRALTTRYGPVAFVGDGINDAPALAAAEVAIAMGTGTEVAIETADVVLMSGNPIGVHRAFQLSAATLRNIRQNLFWAFVYNAALIPVAAGALYPAVGITLTPAFAAGAMAASSVFVVSNALRLRRAQAIEAGPEPRAVPGSPKARRARAAGVA